MLNFKRAARNGKFVEKNKVINRSLASAAKLRYYEERLKNNRRSVPFISIGCVNVDLLIKLRANKNLHRVFARKYTIVFSEKTNEDSCEFFAVDTISAAVVLL